MIPKPSNDHGTRIELRHAGPAYCARPDESALQLSRFFITLYGFSHLKEPASKEGYSVDFAPFYTRGRELFSRAVLALCVLALAVLSWTPSAYMIRTGILSGHQEHFLAYVISGCVLAMARRVHYLASACSLCSYAALLELGQYAVPGRHPAFADFSASSFGALLGLGVIMLIHRGRRI